MASDKTIGGTIFTGSVVGIVLYALLLLYFAEITLVVTAFVAVALLLTILAWIGYTMATTPLPEPISDLLEKSTSQGPKSSDKEKGTESSG